MGRTDKILDNHDRRLKVLEENAGLLHDGAANMKLLMDTIREQAIILQNQNMQIETTNEALRLRNEFLTMDKGKLKEWEDFLKKKDKERKEAIEKAAAAQKPGNAPALELKDDTRDICAPHRADRAKTMCGKLQVESRMVQHGEAITCLDCIEDLNKTQKPPAEPVAAPKDEQPQDAGKEKCQNCGTEIQEPGECDDCSGIKPEDAA